MIPLVMAAAGAAINLGGSIAKGIKGAQRAKKMREAIAQYDRQTLENTVRGKVGVSTLGADLKREEAGRTTASSMDALASGGVRGMVGGVGKVQANNNLVNREIGADLDRQQQTIDMAAARDDARIRQMQERREEQDLAGMGREMESGRQDMWSGLGDAGQTLMSIGGMAGAMGLGMGNNGGGLNTSGLDFGAMSTGFKPEGAIGTGMQTTLAQQPLKWANPFSLPSHTQMMNEVAPK